MSKKIIIIGAGLAGMAAALTAAKKKSHRISRFYTAFRAIPVRHGRRWY